MEKTFLGHLVELRRRVLVVLVFLFFASILSYPLAPAILNRVKADLLSGVSLVVLSPMEALMVYIKVSLAAGFVLTLPVFVYQVWAFVSPALGRKEKKMLFYVILPSVFLFLIGAFFGYFILLPITLKFLVDTASYVATPMFSLDETISFIVSIILLLGLVFQLPLVTAVLSRLGLVTPDALRSGRRYSIVLIFIVAAAVTADPSAVTQILVAVPMVFLYEVGVWTAKLAS